MFSSLVSGPKYHLGDWLICPLIVGSLYEFLLSDRLCYFLHFVFRLLLERMTPLGGLMIGSCFLEGAVSAVLFWGQEIFVASLLGIWVILCSSPCDYLRKGWIYNIMLLIESFQEQSFVRCSFAYTTRITLFSWYA